MSKRQALELLAEVLEVLDKYDPKVIDELIHIFSGNETLDLIQSSLSIVSAIQNNKSEYALEYQRTETKNAKQSEKEEILYTIKVGLQSKKYLKTLKEIREYAIEEGLEQIVARSRDKAIDLLLESLQNLPLKQLRRHYSTLNKNKEKNIEGRSLEDWSDLILNKTTK